MRFKIDQPTRPRNRRVVGRRLVEPEPQEIAQRQRIRRAPGDAALRVNALEIANQQQPEIDARWQARPTHLRIKSGALGFREVIEDVFAQQLIQAPIKRVTRGCR